MSLCSSHVFSGLGGELGMNARTGKKAELIADIDILADKYLNHGWTMQMLADEWDTNPPAISKVFKQFNIKKPKDLSHEW